MRCVKPNRALRTRLLAGAQLMGWLRWDVGGNGRPAMSIDTRIVVTPPAIRVFRGISQAWRMNLREEMCLLGLPRPVWRRCVRDQAPVLPIEVLKRIALVARVFEAINVLLPPDRADAWMRSPNAARIFGGRSALDLMVAEGRTGISVVRLYLQGQIYG